MQNDKQVSIRLDAALLDRIDGISHQTGLPRSEVIRNALVAGLADGEKQVARMRSPAVRAIVRALLAIDGDKAQAELFEGILQSVAGTDAATVRE